MFRRLKVFFAFSLLSLSFFANAAFAESADNYMISGVTASASSKSAGEAKNIATNNARRDAFTTLLTRLSLSTAIANDASNDEIFDMVRSEQIAEEKIAGSNYSATFNILFARSAVDSFLNQKSIKRGVVVEDSFLVLPVKMTKRDSGNDSYQMTVWEDANEWKAAIAKALKNKALNNFIIPDSDLSNVSMINQENVEKLEYSQIEPLFARYKTVGAYVLFFYFDDIENKVSITVKNIRKLQRKQVKLSFVNVNRLSYQGLMDKVADKTLEYLVSSQKDNAAKSVNSVKLEVQISSFGNWKMLKNKIENSNLINQMNIEAISKDYVKVEIDYAGSDPDIISAFAKIGLTLTQKSDNSYLVSVAAIPAMPNPQTNIQ